MEVDLSQLGGELALKVDEVLRADFNKTVLAAAERQRRMAAFNYLNRPLARDGFGEQTLMIDPVFDAMWRTYYGHNYSESKDLMRFLAKRNPEIVVRSRGTRVQVGYAPGSGSKRPLGRGTGDES